MTDSPIHDSMQAVREAGIKLGYITGRDQMHKEVMAILKTITLPSKTVQKAIADIEALNA